MNDVIIEFFRLFEIQQFAEGPQANDFVERNGNEVVRYYR